MLYFDELDELEGQEQEEEQGGEQVGENGAEAQNTDPEAAGEPNVTDDADDLLPGGKAPEDDTEELPIAKHTNPGTLNLQEARRAQALLIREFTRKEFQDGLHEISGRLEDDPDGRAAALAGFAMDAQVRVARAQGFEASAAGVAQMRSALLPYAGCDPESAHRGGIIRWLLDPVLQRTELVPKGPARCTLFSTAHIYTREVGHLCRLEVHINDTVRCLKENIYLSTRKSWMMQKLFFGERELHDQVPLSSLMRVGATTSFRLEYRHTDVTDWLQRVKKEGAKCLAAAPAELLANPDFILPAVQISAQVLGRAAPELRADREFVLQVVPHCGQALRHAAPELRADREVVLAAVQQDPWALELAAPALHADRELVMEAVRRDSWALQFAVPELRQDEEFILLATSRDPTIILQVLPELQKDRRAVLGAIRQDWHILESLGPEMARDREVLIAAVRQSGWALQHVPQERLGDREIVLEAVRNHGDVLRFADPALLNDREVLMAAVCQSGTALGLARADMQDLEMAIAAVKVDKRSLVFVARRLRPDVLKFLGLDKMPDWAKRPGGESDDDDDEFSEHTGPNAFFSNGRLDHYYATLDLPLAASKEEIKRKYHQLALQYHPDKYAGDVDTGKRMFQQIQEAYEALQDALSF